MTYKEYESALNAIIKAKDIIRKEGYASTGKKEDDAAEALYLLANAQDLLNNLYGGVYDED